MGPADATSLPEAPDLAGRRLALVEGYASAYAAHERWPLAPRVPVRTPGEGFAAVASGQADLFFTGLPNALQALQHKPALRVLKTFSLPVGLLRLAVRRDRDDLLARLEAGLRDRRDEEVAEAVRAGWRRCPCPARSWHPCSQVLPDPCVSATSAMIRRTAWPRPTDRPRASAST